MHTPFLRAALHLFNGDENEPVRLSGGNFSTVYEFVQSGKPAILRLTPPGASIDITSMTSILHWMRYLADHAVSVPGQLLSRQGRLVETLHDDQGTWLASAVEKARGVRAETLAFGDWNERRFSRLGRETGKMHRVSRGYQPPEIILPRPRWDETGNNFNPIDELENAEPLILQRRMQVIEDLNSLSCSPDGCGLVHADLQCANFFIDPVDDTITLFDFDDCCYGWFMMDVALPLLDFLVLYPGHDRKAFAYRFLESFLTGYRAEYPLDLRKLYKLPVFLKLLEIGLYLQVYRFAQNASPDSWVGKFIPERRELILADEPFVELA